MPALVVPQFKQGERLTSWSRGTVPVTELVIHESVTASREDTIAVLKKRGLSVHVIVDRDGSVTQHAPLERQCAHAGSPHNKRSVALEIVNPYYGNRALPGQDTLRGVWVHKGEYTIPSFEQLEAAWGAINEIVRCCPQLKLTFPGVERPGVFNWGRYSWLRNDPRKRPLGVVAHHRWEHADGLFIEHYAVCRSLGLRAVDAFLATVSAASSGRRVTPLPQIPT